LCNIVLFKPEIAQNTGNIGRLCVGADCKLHIIKPMKFFIDDKNVRRAGLDYWAKLDYTLYESLNQLMQKHIEKKFYFATTKTKKLYTKVSYKKDDFIVFGPESSGIPEDILQKYPNNLITIPMHKNIRSLNLSNSVGIILYETIRQIGI